MSESTLPDNYTFFDLPFTPQGTVVETTIDEGGHYVTIGYVTHPTGEIQPAVHVRERHPTQGYTGERRFSVSSLVHALLNLTEDEVWTIGGRDADYVGSTTPHVTPTPTPHGGGE